MFLAIMTDDTRRLKEQVVKLRDDNKTLNEGNKSKEAEIAELSSRVDRVSVSHTFISVIERLPTCMYILYHNTDKNQVLSRKGLSMISNFLTLEN